MLWQVGRWNIQIQYLCLINHLEKANANNWLKHEWGIGKISSRALPASFPFEAVISIPQLPKETSTESLSSQEALPLTMRRETDKGVVLCCSNYPQVITLSFSGLWRLNVSQRACFPDLFTKAAARLGRSCEWVQTRVARDKLSFHWGFSIHQTQPCSKYLLQSRSLYGASGSPTGGSQHRPPGHGNKDMPSLLTSLLLLRSHSWLLTWHLQRLNVNQEIASNHVAWVAHHELVAIWSSKSIKLIKTAFYHQNAEAHSRRWNHNEIAGAPNEKRLLLETPVKITVTTQAQDLWPI